MDDHQNQVALFAMCLVDQAMPEIGMAALKLLRRAGYEVAFPEGQTCCGQPFFNSGFQREAANIARHTIEVFENFPAVVMPSGSCVAMIRTEYPHLFEGEPAWRERAERLAARTYELCEFLVNQARWHPASVSTGRAVTYHDSCHSTRLLDLRREPRELLAAAGCTIIEMTESDRCCGFGGLFSVRMPEVSNAMTLEKLRLAKDSGVTTLVTIDPGCLMQIRGLIHKTHLRAEHVAVVVEEATR